jgi:hypothetical protein
VSSLHGFGFGFCNFQRNPEPGLATGTNAAAGTIVRSNRTVAGSNRASGKARRPLPHDRSGSILLKKSLVIIGES